MKFWWILFVLFFSMTAIVGGLILWGEGGNRHGYDHPTKKFISVGGPADERVGNLPWFAATFGTLQILAFVMLLTLGLKKSARDSKATWNTCLWFFGATCSIYVALLLGVFALYLAEINSNPQAAGFPTSSSFTLFVFWPFPLVYILFYSFGFRRLIHSSDTP